MDGLRRKGGSKGQTGTYSIEKKSSPLRSMRLECWEVSKGTQKAIG